MSQQRRERLADEIRRKVAALLQAGIRDPRVRAGLASVVRVDLSADLRVAKIYVSVLGEDDAKRDTIKGLESASGFIRSELASFLHLRFVPEVRFLLDEGIAHGARVAELLNRIHADEPSPGEEKGKSE